MSKNHLKSPPVLYFSGALSATLQNHLKESLAACAFLVLTVTASAAFSVRSSAAF